MRHKFKKTAQKKHITAIAGDDSGYVLLLTMIILLLVTLIGLSGVNTASTDIQITYNYKVYKENLALADAAANRAKSLIAYDQADISDTWVNDVLDLWNTDKDYLKNGDAWDSTNTPVLNEINVTAVVEDWDKGFSVITPATLTGQPDTEYVVYRNLNSAEGNSVVIARSRKNNGDVIIEVGFDEN